MFFSRKNRLDTKASPDSLRPMLHVAACLKGYLKQLAQREVESLGELRMVRGAFSGVLREADQFQEQLHNFGNNFSNVNQAAGRYREVRESIGSAVGEAQGMVEEDRKSVV